MNGKELDTDAGELAHGDRLTAALHSAEKEKGELEGTVKSMQSMLASRDTIISAITEGGAAQLRTLQAAWTQTHICAEKAQTLVAQHNSPEVDDADAWWKAERLIGALGVLLILTRPSPAHELCYRSREMLRKAFGPEPAPEQGKDE